MRYKFSTILNNIATYDNRIVLLIGDVEYPTIDTFKKLFPDRFFNLGLCEQSIISIAAGMAHEGFIPIVYSITPFLLERAFEQIKIDIDENNLHVILVGYDDYPTYGPTHMTLNSEKTIDIFKHVKGFFPRNEEETEKSLLDAYLLKTPSMICLKKIGPPYINWK